MTKFLPDFARKTAILLVGILVPSAAAHAVIKTDIGDFYYDLTGTTASVLGLATGVTSINNPTIPSTVSYNGTDYTVTTIASKAFQNKTGLTGTLTLPESLVTIDTYAFDGCSGLTGQLVLPESLKTLATRAFAGCSGFTGDLTIPAITEPNGMHGIFNDCTGLNGTVTILCPTVAVGMFAGCSNIKQLVLSANVSTIWTWAFRGCTGLQSISCEATTPPVIQIAIPPSQLDYSGDNSFETSLYSTCPLYVPEESISKYASSTYEWSKFLNIKKLNSAITLNYPDACSVTVYAPYGEDYALTLNPPTGWAYNSLTVNGTQQIGSVSTTGVITLTNLPLQATVNFTMVESSTSGIVSTGSTYIETSGKTISIYGTATTDNILMTNLDGILLYKEPATSSRYNDVITFDVFDAGIYYVNIGGTTDSEKGSTANITGGTKYLVVFTSNE